MKINLTKALLAVAVAPLFLASHAMGAVISWSAPTDVDINLPTQISLNGQVVVAQTDALAGASTMTVNTVVFSAFGSTAGNNSDVHMGSWGGVVGYITPTTAYQTLIKTGAYVANGISAANPLTFSNLLAGQTYEIQLWTTYWDNNSFKTRYSSSAPTQTSGSVYNATPESGTLNLGAVSGGIPVAPPPQFVIGTFTMGVGETSQNLYIYGDSYGMLGAFQLRAVPEPTTVALLAVGVLALVVRHRIRLSAIA